LADEGGYFREQMEDLTGKQLNQYQIVAPLGEGGMAAVYKAYQPSMERYVALKILPRQLANEPQFVGRFEQEAKVIANLQHPHILPVFDYGEADNYTFIVMPFVETGTLSDLLFGKPLPLPQIRSIISQVGDALDYAHTRGIVHRDIKPSNILMDESGNCLLADFGIAKMVEATTQFTQTGAIVGTPAYMSPEQGLGTKPDGRSDIYSLGIILYEMATGRPPYEAETPMAIVIKHINDPLPLPRSVNPNISEALERIILKALVKERENRYQTCAELVQAIQALPAPSEPPLPVIAAPTTATLLESPAVSPATALESPPITATPIPPPAPSIPTPVPPAPRSLERRSWLPWIIVSGAIGLGLIAILLIWFIFSALQGRGDEQPIAGPLLPTSTQTVEEEAIIDSTPAGSTNTPVAASPSETPVPTEEPTFTLAPILGIGATQVSPIDGSVLVYVPEGEFFMGSDPDAPYFWGAEAPEHTIYLNAFWIQRTEVTTTMYQDCVSAGACPSPSYSNSRTYQNYYGNPEFVDYPVIFVTYAGAQAYCQWIEGHLPTEAEWEKAARGTDGRLYPWGNEEINSNLANFCDTGCPNSNIEEVETAFNDGYRDVAPVGSFPEGASPYGALDMAGNVLEWVSDYYAADYYAKSPYENPSGPESGTRHPIRGGSWFSGRAGLRTSARASLQPNNGYDTLGFRCAVTPSK